MQCAYIHVQCIALHVSWSHVHVRTYVYTSAIEHLNVVHVRLIST